MKAYILIFSISMFVINVAQAVSVDDCLRTSFMDRDVSNFSLGVIKDGGDANYVLKQSKSCPFDTDCKKKYRLTPLENVIVSHTKEGWSCSWYKQVTNNNQIRKRIGWIKTDAILIRDLPSSADQRKGNWIKVFGSGAFSIDEYAGVYSFRGKATYRKKGKKIITEITGDGVNKGNFLKFKADRIKGCNVKFKSLGNRYAIINEIEDCGRDIGFTGVYKRVSSEISYDNYLLPIDIYNKLDLRSFNSSLVPSFDSRSDTYLKNYFKIKNMSKTTLVLEGDDRYWVIESLSNNRIRVHDKVISGTYDSTDVYETITKKSRIAVRNSKK